MRPLAQTGDTAKEMEAWIEAANNGDQPWQPVYIKNEKDKRVLLAEGVRVVDELDIAPLLAKYKEERNEQLSSEDDAEGNRIRLHPEDLFIAEDRKSVMGKYWIYVGIVSVRYQRWESA